ncbi:hypothetical protein K3495_g6876 [Podosphaera aphanis]|nr:hypothetical protein K3495_g6876 [Podosphaera aphanis]
MTIRCASHAGSWYTQDPNLLSRQIDIWLSHVPTTINNSSLPISNARVIIAPHAGYAYSGPAAAYAYAALSITPATKRIFILGPSHTLYLTSCALTTHSQYETPGGNLKIDRETVNALHATRKFDLIAPATDESEHSLEMHLPYIHKIVSRAFDSPADYPRLIPILVGSTSPAAESDYGRLLAPYMADPSNVFIISSDFCHWGLRFGYTYYLPKDSGKQEGHNLSAGERNPENPPIHESITKLDQMAIKAIESGSHKEFINTIVTTENTVCGRHPIGIAMAAMKVLEKQVPELDGDTPSNGDGCLRFKFIRYEQSSKVVDIRDSSVSYASAYAKV